MFFFHWQYFVIWMCIFMDLINCLYFILLQIHKPLAVQSQNTSSFKRPDPPSDNCTIDAKRRKLDVPTEQLSPLTANAQTTTQNRSHSPLTLRQVSAPVPNPSSQQNSKPKWHRCHSESHVSIMKALSKSCKYLIRYFVETSIAISKKISNYKHFIFWPWITDR